MQCRRFLRTCAPRNRCKPTRLLEESVQTDLSAEESLLDSLRLLEESVQTECRDQAVQTEKYLTGCKDQAVQVESRPWVCDPRPSFENIELKAMAAGGLCQNCGVELQVSSWGVCNDCILDCKLEEPATYKKWLGKIRSSSSSSRPE